MVQPAPRLWLSIVSWARAWPMLSWELSFITSKHDTSARPQQITSKTTAKVVKLTKSSITVQNDSPPFHLKHKTFWVRKGEGWSISVIDEGCVELLYLYVFVFLYLCIWEDWQGGAPLWLMGVGGTLLPWTYCESRTLASMLLPLVSFREWYKSAILQMRTASAPAPFWASESTTLLTPSVISPHLLMMHSLAKWSLGQ